MTCVAMVPCMTRTRHLAAGVALAIALTGCSDRGEPAAAPATPAASSAAPSPTPSPTPQNARIACNTLVDLDIDIEFDPNVNQKIGHDLSAASNPGIQAAGNDLVIAANDALAEPGPAANIAIAKAQIAVAEACAEAFGGDGPW